jgi:hypothetical protein
VVNTVKEFVDAIQADFDVTTHDIVNIPTYDTFARAVLRNQHLNEIEFTSTLPVNQHLALRRGQAGVHRATLQIGNHKYSCAITYVK